MWLFSKDASANFGYSFSSEPRNKNVDLGSGWSLYDCKNKKGEEYSMLVFELANRSPAEISDAQNYLKRLKTLRHPNMLTYVDSCESTRCIQIVTEWVEPLHTYLREKSDLGGNFMFMTSWGIYQVTKAVLFLHDDCRLQHNNIRLTSIFVTRSGEWKLGGHSLIASKDERAAMGTQNRTGSPYLPPDGELIDSWGLGCLLWEVYHAQSSLSVIQDLRDTEPLPSPLLRPYQGLVHPKLASRQTVNAFYKMCMQPGSGFFANFYVETLLFLEEVHIRNADEKKEFFQQLGERVESFPDAIAKYKILPHLMNAFQYGGAGVEVLIPLLKLSKLLEQKEFEQNVVPCLVKMFSSQDRATRVKLLEHLPSFVDHLPEKIVCEQIFPSVSTGFADTHPMVREATLRAMLPMAPRLTEKILNDVLLKHLMTLQVKDEQGGIRANSTVCLAKLANHFTDATRQGVLLNGFLKCLRDPFSPARQAAASAILGTLGYYGGRELACKVMPCVALLTIDAEKEVRTVALRVCRAVLTRLEEASDNPELLSKTQSAEQGKSAANEMGWTNWAVSALSSKLLSRSSKADSSTPEHQSPAATTLRSTPSGASTNHISTPQDEMGDSENVKDPKQMSSVSGDRAKHERRAQRKTQGVADNDTEEDLGKEKKKAPLKLGTKMSKVPAVPQEDNWQAEAWNDVHDDFNVSSSKMESHKFSTNVSGSGGWNSWEDDDLQFGDTSKLSHLPQNEGSPYISLELPVQQKGSGSPVTFASDWNTDTFLNDCMEPTPKPSSKTKRPLLTAASKTNNGSATAISESNTAASLFVKDSRDSMRLKNPQSTATKKATSPKTEDEGWGDW